MFLIGLFIHTIFLFSIFDIYFKSPIVRGVEPYFPHHETVSDRIVLFIVDGLRAESFTDYDTMKNMRDVASTRGRWGISHTRVPTESRPGHIAVIAGFYEDPSAVAKGWKENPVDFDSVFNQTLYTWSWGTYDIVDIFTKGTVDGHIFVNKFDPYEQSFSTDKNTTLLDGWVFDNVKEFLSKAKSDENLNVKLQQKKIAFFLHLLGTDTAGHTHKPRTEHFLTTLRYVDEGIKEMEALFKDFYNDDGKTTFLMTSDHGMTDWGSHGAGDNHETETPYVLWGAGVSLPEKNDHSNSATLPTDRQFNINQADLTPLMSTILSIPVPVNSIGKLPANLLDMTLENKAKAVYSNCRQLASQYNKKRLDIESNALPFLYQPFEPFDERKYEEIIAHSESMLSEGHYEKVILLSEEIMELSSSGLNYYHNYYQKPLLILVTLSFIGWIVYLLKTLLIHNMNTQTDHSTKIYLASTNNFVANFINFAFIILSIVSFYLVMAQSLPYQYYIYFLLPIVLWWYALTPFNLWIVAFAKTTASRNKFNIFLEITCYVLGSLAMGFSFSYRWTLSLPLLGMALWPLLSSARKMLSSAILLSWSTTCCLLSAFTFIPVVGKQVYIELVVLSGVIWLCIYAAYIRNVLVKLYKKGAETKREMVLSIFQMVILIVALQNIYVQSKRFDEATPVSHFYQSLAWVIAIISLFLPLIHSKRLLCRIMAVNTSIFTFYIMLSVLHEGLFLATLIINALIWIYIEFRLAHSFNVKILDCTFTDEVNTSTFTSKDSVISLVRSVSHQDFRRAFFFLVYIIIAFFGTGNIASLNSFEVRWVTCFVTSFQPFLITGLILLKTLFPFLCVAGCFRAVQHLTKAPTGFLNIIVLIYSNIMGIHLLYNVRNTGSWLEIGTSISQFVIVQVITLFIVLIHKLAKFFTDVNLLALAQDVMKVKKKLV